jgi:hypothetical protein
MLAALVALLAALLAACGSATGSASPSTSADEVHTQWVEALRDNDRQAALAVRADGTSELIAAEVDQILRETQQEISSGQIIYYNGENFGEFQQVTTLPVRENGAGRVGVSVWSYSEQPMCYRTTLAETSEGWRVTQWGAMQKQECQEALQRTP